LTGRCYKCADNSGVGTITRPSIDLLPGTSGQSATVQVVCLHLASQLRSTGVTLYGPQCVTLQFWSTSGIALNTTNAHKPLQHVKLQTMW